MGVEIYLFVCHFLRDFGFSADSCFSLDLLRMFYSEFMVDHTTFLSWLVQMLASCNLAQAGFMARLSDDYLSDMGSCRALVKPFVDACLGKLRDVSFAVEIRCCAKPML